MEEELCFLRAVMNHPDDDTPRLVYADWLQERDDPRAEFLRLEVQWHRSDGAKSRRDALARQMRDLRRKLDAQWVGWMSQARHQPPGGRLDLAFLSDGMGLIDVRGGAADTVLLVEGRPVALNWDDCAGSVGQYLVFTGHTRGQEHARQLAALVEGEFDGGQPLADQVGPLLAMFAPGTYCLGYTPSTARGYVATLDCAGAPAADPGLINYYPADQRNLVGTQPPESLDAGRVDDFRGHIRAGRRPTVLTASAEGAWCEFVIDGHHKLAAYNREGVSPAVLGIVRVQAPEISLEEGLGCLPSGHPGVAEYRRMKGYAGG